MAGAHGPSNRVNTPLGATAGMVRAQPRLVIGVLPGSLRLVGWATTFACLFCIAQFVLLRPLSAASVAQPVIWLSVLNATLCTALPVLLVMLAIERLGAATVAQTGMIGPLSTILMGVWLLGESLTPVMVVGTVLVLAGIYVFTYKPQKR